LDHLLAVVIPAHNEAPRLGSVLDALPADIDGRAAVRPIVVDDGSTDGTAAVAANRATVLRHAINLGKGGALHTGCELAIAQGCDLLAVMDADGQHLPSDLPALVRPLLSGAADFSLAYRTFSRDMPAAMRLGNWGLSALFKIMFRASFRDTQCGFRAFTATAYRHLRWDTNDYFVETEMLIRAARAALRNAETPIQTVYHDRYKGTTIVDGGRIFSNMLMWRILQTP
jgi:glycosyltransferase involved in cell wall biosynthesis